MKKMYLKKFKGDIQNLARLEFDKRFIVDMDNTDEKKVIIVEQDVHGEQDEQDYAFKMVKELPKEKGKVISIGGYVEKCNKDKFSKIKADDNRLMASLYGEIPILRELPKHYKVIGYIRIKNSDTYIAIIKRKILLIPIILPILIGTILIGIILTPERKTPISLDQFIQGEVGQGEIEIQKAEAGEAQYLRIIMNANPTLDEGTMNLLLQNNKESNEFSMVAEVFLISKVDDNGNILKDYKGEFKIAETPIIHPGENMEYVHVLEDVKVDSGKYDGRVLFTAYRITEEGAMPIGQVAGRINLVVL